jgi:hypothetical protein
MLPIQLSDGFERLYVARAASRPMTRSTTEILLRDRCLLFSLSPFGPSFR